MLLMAKGGDFKGRNKHLARISGSKSFTELKLVLVTHSSSAVPVPCRRLVQFYKFRKMTNC